MKSPALAAAGAGRRPGSRLAADGGRGPRPPWCARASVHRGAPALPAAARAAGLLRTGGAYRVCGRRGSLRARAGGERGVRGTGGAYRGARAPGLAAGAGGWRAWSAGDGDQRLAKEGGDCRPEKEGGDCDVCARGGLVRRYRADGRTKHFLHQKMSTLRLKQNKHSLLGGRSNR